MRKKKKTDVKRKSHNRSSGFGYHRRSVTIISMILLLLVCVLGINAVSLQAKNKGYESQESELKAQIEEQKDRTEEIKDYEAYVKTDEYIKEVAEEKLSLVDPDEIIFKPAK